MDTIQIHQSFVLPAAKGVKATSVDGYAAVNNDSLQDVLCGIKDSLFHHNQTIDALSAKVNEIEEYGIGFDEVTGIIAIPLIIALFAFAFPFLFTVIPHINNKYKSENITKMLSEETSYRCFMGGAIVCASFLFLSGVMALCLHEQTYSVFKFVLNWISVVVAGGYSAIIIWFVYTCINYNSPQKVLKRVGSLFEIKTKPFFKNTINTEKLIYQEEYKRIYRYIDLCKYAVKKQDYKLFISVLMKVNGLKHKRDNLDSLNFEFYEDVLDSYLFGKPNAMMEESLMAHWFMTFKKSDVPNLGLVFRMFARIVSAVQQGRATLFENYLLKSNYGYRFIMNLPIVSYVRGDDLEEQKKVDEKRRSVWRELCEVHNLALAHLFSLGYYEVVRIVQLGNNTGYDRLVPRTGIEVLKMFARCKEKQNLDGTFNHWACEKVIGKNTDPMMLEKFAAIMLLLSTTELYEELRTISPKHLKSLNAAKLDIIKYGKLWQAEVRLKGLFPQIQDVNVQELVESYIKWFEGEDDNTEEKEKVTKKCFITRVMERLSKKGPAPKKKLKKHNEVDIYHKPVLESEKAKIVNGYWNMINGNRGYLLDYLYGDDDDEKTETLEMGSFTYMMFKQYLAEVKDKDYNLDMLGETRIFQSRYLYMLLTAINNMKVNESTVEMGDMQRYLKDYLGDKGEEYMLIEIGGSALLLMSMDRNDKERRGYNDMRVLKATYKTYSFTAGWYINDIPDVEDYEGTIIIMKKADLPYVCSSSSKIGPSVEFEDVSDKEKGKAEVRVTVAPNLMMKYNKNIEITRVKVVKLWR